jgi:hypothetical protein
MNVFDATGNEIRSFDSDDQEDYAVTFGSTLYDDYRVRIARLYHDTYPYTIEYIIEYSINGYLTWPLWMPQEEHASVENSLFAVTVPAESPLRYFSNRGLHPEVEDLGGKKKYVWRASHLKSFESEPVGPSISEQYDYVAIAPTTFEIEGYRGDLNSWSSFGKWYVGLAQGRQTLPPDAKADVEKLITGVADPREKVRILYAHLQNTTRYISVQLGIGGWQPFDAQYVANRKYGDCKALSNYMVAMLEYAGIKAYPVLAYAGPRPMTLEPSFPRQMFNHMIVCIPFEKDSIWLECTSSSAPAGHLGDFTENRTALMVTPEGGVLVRTPSSTSEDNRQMRTASVELTDNGIASATISTRFWGNQRDNVSGSLMTASAKEREDWIRDRLNVRSFQLQELKLTSFAPSEKNVGFDLRLQLPSFASLAGSRLIFQPNLIEKNRYVPREITHRKNPVIIPYPYLDIDTIRYSIPAGFAVEALPQPTIVETDFATFHTCIEPTEAGTLLYTRRLEMKLTSLPPERYREYRAFLQTVVNADKASAAIVRK